MLKTTLVTRNIARPTQAKWPIPCKPRCVVKRKPTKPAITQIPSAVREPDPELLAETIRRVLMDDKFLRALARALLCAGLTSIRDSVAEGGDER